MLMMHKVVDMHATGVLSTEEIILFFFASKCTSIIERSRLDTAINMLFSTARIGLHVDFHVVTTLRFKRSVITA